MRNDNTITLLAAADEQAVKECGLVVVPAIANTPDITEIL